MKKWLLRIVYIILVLMPIGAIADYTATTGTGSTIFSFVCFTTKICPAQVLMNSSGTEIATSSNPVRIDPTGTTTQPISGSVTANAGTNLNTSTLATSANQTNASQKSQIVDGSGNVIGSTSNALNVNVNNSTTAIKGSSPVVNGADNWNTIAASQTAQILSATSGGTSGTTGDYLSFCVLQPTTTAAGTMTISDNTTTIFTFTTGTLSNLAPISIPIGSVSKTGGWKVTTGANETVTCVGSFT